MVLFPTGKQRNSHDRTAFQIKGDAVGLDDPRSQIRLTPSGGVDLFEVDLRSDMDLLNRLAILLREGLAQRGNIHLRTDAGGEAEVVDRALRRQPTLEPDTALPMGERIDGV